MRGEKRDIKCTKSITFFSCLVSTENNLMGAAEWTGYSSPTVGTTYASFQHPSYDQASSLPSTVLPTDVTAAGAYNPAADFHCGSSQATAAAYNNSQFTSLSSWPTTNEMDQYNYGYNGYQYACQPAAQPQYPTPVQPPPPPPAQPTMVLYPQLYSTVNQNQIHLHLHGTEKFMEYLGNPGSFPASNAIDNVSPTSFSVPSSIHASSHQQRQVSLESGESDLIPQDDNVKQQQEHSVVDNENGEQVVWRPY